MESTEDIKHMNKILVEAGIVDSPSLDREERKRLYNVVTASQKDHNVSSSMVTTQEPIQEESSTYNEAEIEEMIENGSGTVYGRRSNDTSLEESCKSNNSNSSNRANSKAGSRKDFGEKDFTKPPINKTVQNYASATAASSGKGDSSKPQKVENKPAPGAAVAVKDLEPNSNSTCGSPQSNAGVWLTKPNGKPNRRSLELPKEEAKTESSEEKDSANNTGDNSQDRESPDIEEAVVYPLMSLAFENRNRESSSFPDFSFPPLSVPRDEWVNGVGQHLFAKKVARIKAEAANKKWACLSERNISVMSLIPPENPSPRASPSHNKDDGASSSADIENSPKTRLSPENVGDNAREGSPEVAVVDMPPKQDTNITETADAAMALPDTTSRRYGKMDSPQNSPSGRIDENNFAEEQGRRRSLRRGKQGKRGNRGGGSARSSSVNVNEDNSNGAQNSPTAKNNEKEYIHDSSHYPPIGGSPCNENKIEENLQKCPMCDQPFPENVIEHHAWTCTGTAKPDDKQVAGGDKNEGERDVAEIKRKHKTSSNADSDEDVVAKKPKPSTFQKEELNSTERKHPFSSDEDSSGEFVTKRPKRSTFQTRNIFVNDLISEDEDEPPNTSGQ